MVAKMQVLWYNVNIKKYFTVKKERYERRVFGQSKII